MDFILDLPRTARKNDSIYVVVDRFLKIAYFLSCSKASNASKIACLYSNKVIWLHGLPESIVYDRDVRFISYFWKTLWYLIGTKLNFLSAYHPQTNGQIKVVNRSLENLLQCLVGENTKNWDLLLSRAKFTYNSSINRTIGMSPFEIVYSHYPRKSVDLIPITLHTRMSKTTESFTQHVRSMHKEITKKINVSNQIYKQLTDSHQRAHDFADGDYVMIQVRPEQVSLETIKKLHTHGVGPFRILKKIEPNVYIINLSSDYGISST